MIDLSQCKAVILLFAMKGCPACEEFKPRFERHVEGMQSQGLPFVFYPEIGSRLPQGSILVLILDSESKDPMIQSIADQYGVEGLPTTLLLTWSGYLKKEGSISDDELSGLLNTASVA